MASGDMPQIDDNPALDPLLQCTICMDRFDRPKLLPCGHTFCLHCIEGLLHSSNYHVLRNITCPVCRKESRIPNAGPHTLQDDFRVEQIRDAFTLIAMTPTAPRLHCDICLSAEKENNAEFECLNCHKLLCTACVDKHNSIPHLKSHTVVKRDDQFGKVICRTHNENCAFVCRECARLVCVTCLMTSCAGHTCDDCPSVTSQLHADVVMVTKDVDSKLERMQESVDLHSVLYEEQSKMFEIAENTLQEHTKKLINIIEGNSRQIKESLDKTRQEILTNIRTSKEKTEEQLRATQGLSNFKNSVSGSGMDPQTLALLPSLNAMIAKTAWTPSLPRTLRYTIVTQEDLGVGALLAEDTNKTPPPPPTPVIPPTIARTITRLEKLCSAANKFFVLFLILSVLLSVVYAHVSCWWGSDETPTPALDFEEIETLEFEELELPEVPYFEPEVMEEVLPVDKNIEDIEVSRPPVEVTNFGSILDGWLW